VGGVTDAETAVTDGAGEGDGEATLDGGAVT